VAECEKSSILNRDQSHCTFNSIHLPEPKNKPYMMKSFITSLVLISILSSCSQQVDQEQVKASVLAVNKTFMESILSKNAEAIANLYTEDCQLLAPNMTAINGREGVKGYMQHGISSGISAIKFTTLEVKGGNDFAIERGNYEIYIMDSIKVDAGKYLVEWKKTGDQWQLHRDIMNSDMPAPRTVAKAGETVWIVNYYVKADKGNDFEAFIKNELMPALDMSDMAQAQAKAQTRLLAPKQADKSGNLKYVFIMDPVVDGVNYDMGVVLTKKHGEEVGKEKFKQLNALLSKDFEFTSVVQSDL
jgi:ketosteroid isomerase-like protein